jgi:aspartate aminotransferase
MRYDSALMISKAVAANLTKASWIRRMFEEGARLEQERGADKVSRAILVNSPNNPSGVIYPESTFREIEALLARAAQPIVLISDEPYRALVFDDVKVPEVPALVTRSIIATSWSKSLAIPGERIGYLAFSPRMPEAAELMEACTFTSRVLGFVNAPALWQWVVAEVGDQVIDVAPYREKRDLMYEGLTKIGYQCVKPQGAFYVFPRTPIDDDVAFVRMLAEEGVLAVPGSGFGMPGHIRISLTVERDTVVRALPGFERAFRKARGETT